MIRGRVVQAVEQRVPAAGAGVGLEPQVGVPHRPLGAAPERDAEQVGQAEVRPPLAPLVVERRLVGRHEPAAPLDERAELPALLVRQGGDVRQDERLEPGQVGRVEEPVVDHLERDPGLDQRLVPAQRVVLDLLLRPRAAVEPGGLLRVDQAHPGERLLVPQVPLGAVVPAVEVLDDAEPAAVAEHAGELGEPGPQAVGDPVGEPDADLRLALHRVLPAVRLLDAHAEDAPDRLAAHRGAVLLGGLAVGPRGHEPAPRLAVGEQRRGELADGLHVERAGRAAPGVRDHARVGVDLADLPVPEPPELEEALAAARAM